MPSSGLKEITEAYSVLSDPEKKKNCMISSGMPHLTSSASGPDAFTGTAGNGGYREYHFEQRKYGRYLRGDIFEDLFHSKDGKKGGSRSSRFSGRLSLTEPWLWRI